MRAGTERTGRSANVFDRLRLGAGVALTVGSLVAGPAIAQSTDAPLGSNLKGLLSAGRRLSPGLRAAALDTEAAAAKAGGADALDDPTITDSYTFYRDPGVFSAHTVMVTQAFPLWGKRALRREAALADVDASRGRELAARDALDEKIKVAYAQYFLSARNIAINKDIGQLALRMHSAASARYGQGGGDQVAVILAVGEETAAKIEAARLEGEHNAARARLNVLVGRSADAPLAEPVRAKSAPASEPSLGALIARARAANPILFASNAAIEAARTRRTLADKASYPDVTLGAGPLIQTNNRPLGFAATVGLNIPLPWGHENADQHQAAVELGATQERYDEAQLEIEGALGETIAKLHAARATERLLRKEAMPQAHAAFESVMADYGQGKGDLTVPIAAEHQMHDVELRLLQAQLDEQVALAAIERLIGGDL
jgi:outer membrane protein TolC